MEWRKDHTDEKSLISDCIKGKPSAQKKLYELYAPTMMGVCVRYIAERETARDVFQDGFVKVFTKLNTYSWAGSFEGWMRRVFVTTALEYLRQNDALKQSTSIDDYSHSIENTDVSILDKISANDLMQCVSELPQGYRTVFNLYAIEGYSHAEIADLLKISEVTSRSQFMRARKMLQKSVQSLNAFGK